MFHKQLVVLSSHNKMEFWQKIYKSYQTEINFLRREGDKLLLEIKQHETKMNQRKQQQMQPNE